jgi:hypothetical protein
LCFSRSSFTVLCYLLEIFLHEAGHDRLRRAVSGASRMHALCGVVGDIADRPRSSHGCRPTGVVLTTVLNGVVAAPSCSRTNHHTRQRIDVEHICCEHLVVREVHIGDPVAFDDEFGEDPCHLIWRSRTNRRW